MSGHFKYLATEAVRGLAVSMGRRSHEPSALLPLRVPPFRPPTGEWSDLMWLGNGDKELTKGPIWLRANLILEAKERHHHSKSVTTTA